MPKYNVHHDDDVWEIEAADLSDAQEIVLDQEGYTILKQEKSPDYSIYHQRHSRYKNVKVGKSNLSFQNFGCFVCALAFIVKRDPLDVNKELAEKGGLTSGGLIVSAKAAEILGLDLLKGDDKYIPGKMNNVNYMPDWSLTVKEVYLGKSQHFVVRLIDKNNSLAGKYGTLIFDPWEGKFRPINYYKFKSYRLFKLK